MMSREDFVESSAKYWVAYVEQARVQLFFGELSYLYVSVFWLTRYAMEAGSQERRDHVSHVGSDIGLSRVLDGQRDNVY